MRTRWCKLASDKSWVLQSAKRTLKFRRRRAVTQGSAFLLTGFNVCRSFIGIRLFFFVCIKLPIGLLDTKDHSRIVTPKADALTPPVFWQLPPLLASLLFFRLAVKIAVPNDAGRNRDLMS